ncbi:MAG: PTS transporter subunit IIC [Cellulosilyticaceae bacterium]
MNISSDVKSTITSRLVNRYAIKALGGMASGLFCTLIIGLILKQLGLLIEVDSISVFLLNIAQIATVLTGVGIAVGVAHALDAPKLVLYSSIVNGIIGAYSVQFGTGDLFLEGNVLLAGPGDPLSAFVAVVVGVEVGKMVSGKTKIDIILTPLTTICTGSLVAIILGPYFAVFTKMLGEIIQYGIDLQPFLMGVIISVMMGIFLTLPISSAAIAIILGLSGLAAGAATAGCTAQMVGFAVMSYRENKMSGLIAQGIGTSMIQVPNIVRNPKIWIPPIIASAITGPISTVLFKMENIAAGAGMGTSGFVGPLLTWETMSANREPVLLFVQIILLHFLFPAIITFLISEWMRYKGYIKFGDLKLEL